LARLARASRQPERLPKLDRAPQRMSIMTIMTGSVPISP
jgi:hypothetical protein